MLEEMSYMYSLLTFIPDINNFSHLENILMYNANVECQSFLAVVYLLLAMEYIKKNVFYVMCGLWNKMTQ
jgi:hypothetical protein